MSNGSWGCRRRPWIFWATFSATKNTRSSVVVNMYCGSPNWLSQSFPSANLRTASTGMLVWNLIFGGGIAFRSEHAIVGGGEHVLRVAELAIAEFSLSELEDGFDGDVGLELDLLEGHCIPI